MADNTSDKTKKNLIEIVDNAILGFNKKLAMKWMKLTGESKSSLEKSLYYGSGMTIAALGIETQILPLMLPAAYMAYIGTIVSAIIFIKRFIECTLLYIRSYRNDCTSRSLCFWSYI